MGSGESALFFGITSVDNPNPIAPGDEINFALDGPNTGTAIARNPNNIYDFYLNTAGVYRVTYTVPVVEPGQLVLSIQGSPLPYTTSGRDTGTSLITLTTLVHAGSGEQLTLRAAGSNQTSITLSQTVSGQTTYATLLIELVKAD